MRRIRDEPTRKQTRVKEPLFFEARDDHLPVVEGFKKLPALQKGRLEEFVEVRLRGLDGLLVDGAISEADLAEGFAQNIDRT